MNNYYKTCVSCFFYKQGNCTKHEFLSNSTLPKNFGCHNHKTRNFKLDMPKFFRFLLTQKGISIDSSEGNGFRVIVYNKSLNYYSSKIMPYNGFKKGRAYFHYIHDILQILNLNFEEHIEQFELKENENNH
jgi:hypothetical protein